MSALRNPAPRPDAVAADESDPPEPSPSHRTRGADIVRWGKPRTFTILGADGFAEKHEGFALTPEHIIAYQTGMGDDGSGPAYDVTIWENGFVVAIVRRWPCQDRPTYDVIRPDGAAATEGRPA